MDDSKRSLEIPKRETSLPKYTIDELLEQGFVYYSPPINNYPRAINKWMQACSQAYSESDLLKEAKALSNLGCAYRLLGNLKSALEHQWSAWRLTQKVIEDWKKDPKPNNLSNKKKKAPSNFWVNIIQDVIHEVHSFPSYSDNSQGNNISRKSSSLNYAKFKKYKSIKSGINTNIVSTPSTAVWVMDLLSNLGNTYYTLGNFEEAVKYYNASLGIAERILKKYPLSMSGQDYLNQNSSVNRPLSAQLLSGQNSVYSTDTSNTSVSSHSNNTTNNFSTTTNNAYLQQQQQQLQLQQQQSQFLIKPTNNLTSSSSFMNSAPENDRKFFHSAVTSNSSSNKKWLKMIMNKSDSTLPSLKSQGLSSDTSFTTIKNQNLSSGGEEYMEHSISDKKIKKNNKYTYIHRSCIIAKSRAMTHLGLCYDAIYELKKAERYHKEALALGKNLLKYASDMEIKNKHETSINLQMNYQLISSPINTHYASIIANLGNDYYLRSNMTKALNHFYLALNIFEWENDKSSIRKLNINIGSAWINCGKLYIQGSLWHDNELHPLANSNGSAHTSPSGNSNVIIKYDDPPEGFVKITSIEEAKMYIKKGIQLINEQRDGVDKNDWLSKIFFITNYASIHTLINNYKEAFRYYGKLNDIKPIINRSKVFPDVVMPFILYNLSQTTFVELLNTRKDMYTESSPEEKRIKELLNINKDGYEIFPNFLKYCIENISDQMDVLLAQDVNKNSRKNSINSCSSSNTTNSNGNNKNEGSNDSNNNSIINNVMDSDSYQNKAQLQINNIGFDLNLNMEKPSIIFNKSKLKTFQLISTVHLARISWLIYSGAVKPTATTPTDDWSAETNYWLRQQMIMLAGCENILFNIHDRNHPLVKRGLDEFKFMNPENFNNLAKMTINWPWKIEYFDEKFMEKCLMEHCQNYFTFQNDVESPIPEHALADQSMISGDSLEEKEENGKDKKSQKSNKKRLFEKKFGLRINTSQEIKPTSTVCSNNSTISEKPSSIMNKEEDEVDPYLKNALLYSQLKNGKKVYVTVPIKTYTPSVVASSFLYLSILLLIDSVSNIKVYRDIGHPDKLIRLMLRYCHSIYSDICFSICPHCLVKFWSFKPEIPTLLSPVDNTKSYILKNKQSIEDRMIESSKINTSPLAYHLNGVDKDLEDEADTSIVNFYDNVDPKNGSKASSNSNTKSHSKSNSKSESKSESKSGSKSHTKSSSKTDSKTELKSSSKSSSKSDSKSSSKSDSKSDSKSHLKSSSKSELKSDSKSDSKSHLKSSSKSELKSDSKSHSKSSSKSSSKSDSKSDSKSNLKAKSNSKSNLSSTSLLNEGEDNENSSSKFKFLKSELPQKAFKNSSLFNHKSAKNTKHNGKEKENTSLTDDILMKKMVKLDKEKDNHNPNRDIKMESNSIKAFNNINSATAATVKSPNDSRNNNNISINKNSPTPTSTTIPTPTTTTTTTTTTTFTSAITNKIDTPSPSQNNSPNVAVNDESFNLDSYYNSNQDNAQDNANVNLDKYYEIYGNDSNGNSNNNSNSNIGETEETDNKNEKKKLSMLIEKQIDDHISSITEVTNSPSNTSNNMNDKCNSDSSLLDQADDQSDLKIDDQFENILKTLADENFEDIMKERQNIYVDDDTFTAPSNTNTNTTVNKNNDNNFDTNINSNNNANINAKNPPIPNPINVSDINRKGTNNSSMNLNDENNIKSPYVSTGQIEKSFKIISQTLDLSDDFDKEKSDKILNSSESNDHRNHLINKRMVYSNNKKSTNNNSNNYSPKSTTQDKNKKPEKLELDTDKEGPILPKDDHIQEQFYKKMWNVWEKYLSGDTINKNRELIRFPCIHNQAF